MKKRKKIKQGIQAVRKSFLADRPCRASQRQRPARREARDHSCPTGSSHNELKAWRRSIRQFRDMPDVEEESTSWRIGKIRRMERVWIGGQGHITRFLQQVLFPAQSLRSGVSCVPPYQGKVHSCRHGYSPLQVTKFNYEHQEPSLWKSLWKERRKSGLGWIHLVPVATIRIHITHIMMRANNIS